MHLTWWFGHDFRRSEFFKRNRLTFTRTWRSAGGCVNWRERGKLANHDSYIDVFTAAKPHLGSGRPHLWVDFGRWFVSSETRKLCRISPGTDLVRLQLTPWSSPGSCEAWSPMLRSQPGSIGSGTESMVILKMNSEKYKKKMMKSFTCEDGRRDWFCLCCGCNVNYSQDNGYYIYE